MNRRYLIAFFIISISSIIPSQWTNQNPVPQGNDLWSTFFIDDTGWIVGSEGFIKKTTNSGVDWIEQNSGTTLTLKSVQFINQSTGWICGESGLILKTTDGGVNWNSQASGTTQHLTDIHFYDLDTGYAVGHGGTILKTTNGGSSWTSQSSGTSSDLTSIDFVDALLGYAGGNEAGSIRVLKTTDGGINWINKVIGFSTGDLHTVEFINSNIGFVGGGASVSNFFIYKTIDGGDTWIQSTISPSRPQEINQREQLGIYDAGGINSIYFKDSNIGYAVSGWGGWDRGIFTSTDGGSTWHRKYYGSEEDGLLSIYGNSQGQAWVVGVSGVIFITEDHGNSWTQILSGSNTVHLYSGDFIYSIFMINENVGWAGGKRNMLGQELKNLILKTTNGGKIWKTQFLQPDFHEGESSIYFIDENIGWDVTDSKLFRTTDGGENWISVSGIRGSSVFFIDQNTGWVADDVYLYSNGIYKSTDGGITWVQKSSISSSSVYFSDINTGWAVGAGGSIIKSTDGGESWISKTSGTTNNLNCIKFYNSNLGMCVGNSGTVLLSTDGGETWIPQISGTTGDLKAITFINSSSVWITGNNGTILNTTDLGYNWISFEGVTENDLTSLSFINEYTGWIGGMNGTMFKYQSDVVPVELISFTVNVNNNVVQLNWQTATEVNNYGFEIERASLSATPVQEWEKIGFIEGHETTAEPREYLYIDDLSLVQSILLRYRLKQIDFDGNFEYSNVVEVEVVPTQFELSQNYPNPFNPSTTIRFSLPHATQLKLNLYNTLGELVTTISEGMYETGNHKVTFNASNLPSGAYIYRIESSEFAQTRKMMLLK